MAVIYLPEDECSDEIICETFASPDDVATEEDYEDGQ